MRKSVLHPSMFCTNSPIPEVWTAQRGASVPPGSVSGILGGTPIRQQSHRASFFCKTVRLNSIRHWPLLAFPEWFEEELLVMENGPLVLVAYAEKRLWTIAPLPLRYPSILVFFLRWSEAKGLTASKTSWQAAFNLRFGEFALSRALKGEKHLQHLQSKHHFIIQSTNLNENRGNIRYYSFNRASYLPGGCRRADRRVRRWMSINLWDHPT